MLKIEFRMEKVETAHDLLHTHTWIHFLTKTTFEFCIFLS